MAAKPNRPLETLLAEVIDYAGLFPPAGLDMESAVRNYATYLHSPHSWMLGRFILPAARIPELESAAGNVLDALVHPWRLSMLCGFDLALDLERVKALNSRLRSRAVADTIEIKASTREDIHTAGRMVGDACSMFVEIPIHEDPAKLIEAIGDIHAAAKIRTGGITEDAFPSSYNLARFIYECARVGVPFKATAGLHHPIRGEYRLTYEEKAPVGMMFGFLNVYVAAAVAQSGATLDVIQEVLEERHPETFSFTQDGLHWKSFTMVAEQLRVLRITSAISFGSCSFTEPVDDLKALSIL